MNLQTPIAVAALGGLGTLVGYFVSNALQRRSAARLREMEFRLDRYKEFLLAYSEATGQTTFETQSRFVDSVNVILLIGSAELLKAIKELADNFNDPKGSTEKQWPILDRIIFRMRCDLNAPDSKELESFEFPVIVPDAKLRAKGKHPS